MQYYRLCLIHCQANIGDNILRAVALKTFVDPLQQVAMAAMAYAYGPPGPQASVQVAPQQANNPSAMAYAYAPTPIQYLQQINLGVCERW